MATRIVKHAFEIMHLLTGEVWWCTFTFLVVDQGLFTSHRIFHMYLCNLILLKIRRYLFYLLYYVTRRSEKSRLKKMVQGQIGEKCPNVGILLFPWKKFMLLVCQILNICNYEVLFGLIYQKLVTCRASSSYFFLFFSAFSYFSYILAISSYFSYFLAIFHLTCISCISFRGFFSAFHFSLMWDTNYSASLCLALFFQVWIFLELFGLWWIAMAIRVLGDNHKI